MSNPHYTPTASPAAFSRGRSQVIRDEFGLIATGFDSVEAAMQLLAPKASPTFTGTVTATGSVDFSGASQVTVPTVANVSDSTTKAASTAFVQAVLGASGALLPPQATHSGKFLQTNGTSASWQKALPDRISDRYLFTSGGTDAWRTPLPVGSIVVAPQNATLPANWLACNGASVPIASYPQLEPMLTKDYQVERYTIAPRNPKFSASYQLVSGNAIGSSSYLSMDKGTTWSTLGFSVSGLEGFFAAADGFYYYIASTTLYKSSAIAGPYVSHGTVPSNTKQIDLVGGNHVVITGTTVAFSTNGGVSFTNCTPSAGTFHSLGNAPLLVVGSSIYHTSYTADFLLQKSSDGGQTWTSPSTIVTGTSFSGNAISLFHVDGNFLVRTGSGYYVSSSESGPWSSATLPFTPNTRGLTACLGNFWGCSSASLYKSSTGATGTWTTVALSGFSLSASTFVCSVGDRLWIGPITKTYGFTTENFFAYSDDGTTFTALAEVSTISGAISFGVNSSGTLGFLSGATCKFATSPDNLFVPPSTTTYRFDSRPVALGSSFIAAGRNASSQSFLVKSTDNGDTWTTIGSTVTVSAPIASSGSRVVAFSSATEVVVSDGTSRWTASTPMSAVTLVFAAGRFVIHNNSTSMAISVDGDTWITRTAPTTMSNSVVFGSGTRLWVARNGLWFSDDYGVTWTLVQNTGEFNTHRGAAEHNGVAFYHGNTALYASNPSGTSFHPLTDNVPQPTSNFPTGSLVQDRIYFLETPPLWSFYASLTTNNMRLPNYVPSFSGNSFAQYVAYINALE